MNFTVKNFVLKTVDSYVDLAVCEYDGGKLMRRFVLKKHNWIKWSDIPEDILNKEVSSICPYYDQITLEVEKRK